MHQSKPTQAIHILTTSTDWFENFFTVVHGVYTLVSSRNTQ